ncbi:suppressor of deletion of TFIIS [Mycoemilia scoparia]|uniref:Suppressor of deletion of TFIIS n=1 Tax=Mycoemilia scoparia TaxID=417184 RepID=A0A9W8DNN8_9FUNG|nr:suppressor of deletion of TFIIS [Mycoemilia scoparia]
MLCRKYYKDYGVAIKGMVIHDEINPTTFDEEVDQTLPLEYVIKEDPELQSMLKQVNARIWAFTNANYPIICKPDIEAYEKALKDSGTHPGTKCYLVDDSTRNIITAKEMGWVGIHCWPGESEVGDYHIEKIHDLFKVVPELQRSN